MPGDIPAGAETLLPSPGAVDALWATLKARPDYPAMAGRYPDPDRQIRAWAALLARESAFPAACCALGSAIASAPDRPAVESARDWMALATLFMQAQDRPAALAAARESLVHDPAHAEAHLLLGMVQEQQDGWGSGQAALQDAVRLAPDNQLALTALADCLDRRGSVAEAAALYTQAEAIAPLHGDVLRRATRTRFVQAVIENGLEHALRLHTGAEPAGRLLRHAFDQLAATGHKAAALAVGQQRLALNPDDLDQRYRLDLLSGAVPATAPADYVEYAFDRFAASFDSKLVGQLRYNVPAELAGMIAARRSHFPAILDLGCGTGLAAPHLAAFGGTLTGVDLSGGMLEKARQRGSYAVLEKAEAVAFLHHHPQAFDLVFAADMLVYLGDLAPLFAAARRALQPGGVFACSVEDAEGEGYVVHASGRFAHSRTHLQNAAHGFTLQEWRPATIRLEAGQPVPGSLSVWCVTP